MRFNAGARGGAAGGAALAWSLRPGGQGGSRSPGGFWPGPTVCLCKAEEGAPPLGSVCPALRWPRWVTKWECGGWGEEARAVPGPAGVLHEEDWQSLPNECGVGEATRRDPFPCVQRGN